MRNAFTCMHVIIKWINPICVWNTWMENTRKNLIPILIIIPLNSIIPYIHLWVCIKNHMHVLLIWISLIFNCGFDMANCMFPTGSINFLGNCKIFPWYYWVIYSELLYTIANLIFCSSDWRTGKGFLDFFSKSLSSLLCICAEEASKYAQNMTPPFK